MRPARNQRFSAIAEPDIHVYIRAASGRDTLSGRPAQ